MAVASVGAAVGLAEAGWVSVASVDTLVGCAEVGWQPVASAVGWSSDAVCVAWTHVAGVGSVEVQLPRSQSGQAEPEAKLKKGEPQSPSPTVVIPWGQKRFMWDCRKVV